MLTCLRCVPNRHSYRVHDDSQLFGNTEIHIQQSKRLKNHSIRVITSKTMMMLFILYKLSNTFMYICIYEKLSSVHMEWVACLADTEHPTLLFLDPYFIWLAGSIIAV